MEKGWESNREKTNATMSKNIRNFYLLGRPVIKDLLRISFSRQHLQEDFHDPVDHNCLHIHAHHHIPKTLELPVTINWGMRKLCILTLKVNKLTNFHPLNNAILKTLLKIRLKGFGKINARPTLVMIVYIYGCLWSNMKHKIFQVFIRRCVKKVKRRCNARLSLQK